MARTVLREFHDFDAFARLNGEYWEPKRRRIVRIMFAVLLGLWMPILGIWAYQTKGADAAILLAAGVASVPLAALFLAGAFRAVRFTGSDIVVAIFGRPRKTLTVDSLERACLAEERGVRFLILGSKEREIVIPLHDDLEAAIDRAVQGVHATVERR